MLLSSFVRGLSALAAVVLSSTQGTTAAMDHYVAFLMVMSSGTALVSAAFPALVSRHVISTKAADALVCRQWARRVAQRSFYGYLLLLPLLAWLLKGHGDLQDVKDLALLLVCGAPCLYLAPRVTTEQTLLQGRGHGYTATSCTVLFTGASLLAALLANRFHCLALCALGMSVGSWLEWRVVRRLVNAAYPAVPREDEVADTTPLPWTKMLVLTGATAGILASGFFDQMLMARMGAGVQASFGLAARPPSFLAVSLFGAGSALGTALLARRATLDGRTLCLRVHELFGLLLVLGAVVMATLYGLAEPLVRGLYERGAFTPDDTAAVTAAMPWAVLAYVSYPACALLGRSVATLVAPRALLRPAAAFFLAKVIIGLACVESLGLAAIALSTLTAAALQAWMLSRVLSRSLRGTDSASR